MKKIKWIVFLLALIMFGILAYLVLENKMGSFDSFIYKLITFSRLDLFTWFYKFITFFASEFMIGMICFLFLVIFKNKKFGGLVFFNAINIFILNIILKLIFMRDRPYELMIINESGYSFPSGHAMAALGFYGFIIYLIWHFNLSKNTKIIFSLLLGILIVLIGLSRIYLGVHYASDVLAGYMISLAYLIIYITFVKRFLKFGDCDGNN